MKEFKPVQELEGYIRCSPIPSSSDLQKYYEEEFYQAEKPGLINDSSKEVRDSDSEFYNLQYSIFSRVLRLDKSDMHVDLGCGYGHFLEYIRSNNPKLALRGCEVYQEAESYVEKIPSTNFKRIDLNSLSNLKECISDATTISLINTLEHLVDPLYFLKECNKNMNSKSRLLIQVPNDFNSIQKAAVEQVGVDQWWFCPPRHVSYFSPISISSCIESAGLRLVDLITTFPIDMFIIAGLNYRKDPKLGRKAHEMRTQFENNYVKSNGIDSLIELYRNLANAGVGREIIAIAEKP